MHPLPETAQAIDELDPFAADEDLLDQLVTSAARVRVVVPECIGLSFALLSQDVTLTLVATADELAVSRAQPVLESAPETVDADTMDERGWQRAADESSEHGVASTLWLPLLSNDVVTGGFTLYGATRRCFEAHHERLAEILGAWAGGATTNADLSFRSRATAQTAPDVLRDAAGVDVAVGLLAGLLDLSIADARTRLEKSAIEAGLDRAPVARLVIDLLTSRHH